MQMVVVVCGPLSMARDVDIELRVRAGGLQVDFVGRDVGKAVGVTR